MNDDDARTLFLTGARKKAEGLALVAEGQQLMEDGAWKVADAGTPKAHIPGKVAGWLTESGIESGPLGVRKDTVMKWLAPRNRRR